MLVMWIWSIVPTFALAQELCFPLLFSLIFLFSISSVSTAHPTISYHMFFYFETLDLIYLLPFHFDENKRVQVLIEKYSNELILLEKNSI